MSSVKISVIIPVYNSGKYLDECLDSATRQTLDSFEIIIINDGSTDNSAEVIETRASADERIHAITLKQNTGVSAARNAGIKQAQGEYIIFLDADDYWLTNGLLETLYTRARNDSSDLVRFGFCRQAIDGEKTGHVTEICKTIELASDNSWIIRYSACSMLISKELIARNNIQFSRDLSMGEDALFCCSLYCNASRLSTVDATGYCYRINPESANNVTWGKDKLFSTVQWFRLAIDVIRHSPVYSFRPDILQRVISERLQMLADKLAPMAFDILNDENLKAYLGLWRDCFAFADHDFLESNMFKHTSGAHYRTTLHHVLSQNFPALKETLPSTSRTNEQSEEYNTVTLTRDEAIRLGKSLLETRNSHIRCDLGNGVIINLSQNKARHLANQLINNTKPRLTINFTK